MTRTKLADRKLPDYTRGEEIANMTTHIVGGAFGIATLALCTIFPVLNRNYWALVGGIIYGIMMIFLYTMSSVYHGLVKECGAMYRAYGIGFLAWLIGGGVAYTVGIIFFALGIKRRYFHSIFHVFILAGTVLQFVAIFKYCILH